MCASPSAPGTRPSRPGTRRTTAIFARPARTSAASSRRSIGRRSALRSRSSTRPATTASTAPFCRSGPSRRPPRARAAATRWIRTAASTERSPRATRVRGTRLTPATRASTCSRQRGTRSNNGAADEYKNDYDTHWTPSSAEYRVAGEQPADPSLAAQVRVLPLPDVLVERNGGVGHLAARSEQPRGPARQQRGRHRVQRPRAQLHAQCQARRRQPRDIRDRWGWRAPSAGHEMRAPVAYAVGWSYSLGGSACGGAARPTSVDRVFHFLKVSVDGSRVTVAPTDSEGRTFDVQTYDFPRLASTPAAGASPWWAWTGGTPTVASRVSQFRWSRGRGARWSQQSPSRPARPRGSRESPTPQATRGRSARLGCSPAPTLASRSGTALARRPSPL